MKFPCRLCIGDHLTHHQPSIDQASCLFEDNVIAQQQLLVSSQEPSSKQPLVDDVVKLIHSSINPIIPLESDLNTTQVFFTDMSKNLFGHGGIPLALSVPSPSHGIISFYWNDFKQSCLPFVKYLFRLLLKLILSTYIIVLWMKESLLLFYSQMLGNLWVILNLCQLMINYWLLIEDLVNHWGFFLSYLSRQVGK